jgi:hypothetical protein
VPLKSGSDTGFTVMATTSLPFRLKMYTSLMSAGGRSAT